MINTGQDGLLGELLEIQYRCHMCTLPVVDGEQRARWVVRRTVRVYSTDASCAHCLLMINAGQDEYKMGCIGRGELYEDQVCP